MCCAVPGWASASVALGWWISAEGRACQLRRRGEGLGFLSSVPPWHWSEDHQSCKVTLIWTNMPNLNLRQDQNQVHTWGFPWRGSQLVFSRFLKSPLFPQSQEAVKRVSGSWLATFLTPFHNVCASVKGLPQTKHKACAALASKHRVFFLSFFFPFPQPRWMWWCLTGLTCSAVMSHWEKRDKCSYLSPQVWLLGDELCYSALALTNAPQCISVQMCFLFIFK